MATDNPRNTLFVKRNATIVNVKKPTSTIKVVKKDNSIIVK